jgi:Beta/Gamma crystallin
LISEYIGRNRRDAIATFQKLRKFISEEKNMTTRTNDKFNNQTNWLTEATEVQDISNESAATFQGGAAILYDGNQYGWLGTFKKGKSRFSKRANDDVSSVKITFGIWGFYEDSYYGGDRLVLGPGEYDLRKYNFNQKMSSLRRLYP